MFSYSIIYHIGQYKTNHNGVIYLRKKPVLIIISVFVLVCTALLIAANLDVYTESPFKKEQKITFPYFSASDAKGNFYYIDNSMKRVVKVNGAGESVYSITGGARGSNRYYFASEIAVDGNGYLYLANTVMVFDGIFVEKEEIQRYTPEGKYDATIFSKTYNENEMPMSKGLISSLKLSGNDLYFFIKHNNSFQLVKIPSDSATTGFETVVREYDYENANVMLIDFGVDLESQSVFYTTKKGEIFKVSQDMKHTLIYSGDQESTESSWSIPWEVDTDSKGNVYFTDIGQREIRRITPDGNIETVLSNNDLEGRLPETSTSIYYKLSISDAGNISTVAVNDVFIKNADGTIMFYGNTINYALKDRLIRYLMWFVSLLALASAVFLLIELIRKVVKGSISSTVKISFLVIFLVLLSTVVVTNMIFKNLLQRYKNEVWNNMANTTMLVSQIVDGDTLDRITKLEHFMNDDYKKISKQLHDAFNNNSDEWNKNLYCVLHKIKNGVIYSCMYYEDTVGTIYPLDYPFEDTEFQELYDTRKVLKLEFSNPEGDWLYALGLVYNSKGEIAGIIEIGTDLYNFNEANTALVKNIILEVVTIAVILILFLVEIVIFSGLVRNRREKRLGQIASDYPDIGIIRPLVFILFMADCMASAFLPMLAKQLYTPVLGLSENMIIAVSISSEVLFTALFSTIGGYLIDKKGWRPIMLTGLATLTAGLLLCGFAWDSLTFIAAKSIVGIGFGLAAITVNTLIASSPSEDERNHGFSMFNSGMLAGINCGVVIGAMAADSIGYSKVYFIAACVSVITIVYTLAYMKNLSFKILRKKPVQEQSNMTLVSFLLGRKVLAFFLFALMPYLVCGYFLHYFFPLFAEDAGMSASNISRAFLLNGLCVIYLGPSITKNIVKHLGQWGSIIVAGVIYIASLLLFAYNATLTAAFIVVLLLGIADSFGFTTQSGYFSDLDAVKRLGSGKAMGSYSLFENLGQTVGPFIFASAALLGTENGIRAVAFGLLGAYFVFAVVTVQLKRFDYKRTPDEKIGV